MSSERSFLGSHPAAASDAALVSAVLSGDRTAMTMLIRRYNQVLYRTARSIVKDETEAEDVVQEGFLLAYRGLANFRHDARLSTWLIRIVANVAIGRLRRSSHRPHIIQSRDPMRQRVDRHDLSPERPEQALGRAEIRQLLETKIDRLPDPYCVVFVLHAVQELSIEETSEALGIPQATVRSRFSRARKLLRKSLSMDLHGALSDAFPFAGERCARITNSVIAALYDT